MSKRGRRKRKDVSVDKWKNKVWYIVLTPKYFGNIQIAEIPSSADILGRTVETTLYEITNDFSVKFPESEIQLFNYYPDLEEKLKALLNKPLQRNTKLLIVAAKNIALARKSAFITAIYTQTDSKTELLELFE